MCRVMYVLCSSVLDTPMLTTLQTYTPCQLYKEQSLCQLIGRVLERSTSVMLDRSTTFVEKLL